MLKQESLQLFCFAVFNKDEVEETFKNFLDTVNICNVKTLQIKVPASKQQG
jgi:hypothetical protein